ncbi:hypothetical protein [Thermococcus sp.]
MRDREQLLTLIRNVLNSNGVVSIIDRDMASFGYLLGLDVAAEYIEGGSYTWLVSYEPLQSLLRDMKRLGINYEEHLGKTLFIFDAFGSMKGIEPEMEGVLTLKGYLDDNVFVLKYGRLVSELIKTLEPRPESAIVVGHLESGICRLFQNPLKVQRRLWNLFLEVPLRLSAVKTYLLPECPGMEDLAYFYSDLVIESFLENDERKLVVTKGGEGEP